MKSSIYRLVLLLAFLALVLPHRNVLAMEVPPATAVQAAQGWLNLDNSPMGRSAASAQAVQAREFADENGKTLYHVVSLAEKGLVIVAGDDRIEPVIAWIPEGEDFEPDPENPLYLLLEQDMRGRLAAAEAQSLRALPEPNQKWEELLQAAYSREVRRLTDLSDIRVAPFVVSKWNQSTEGGQYCYNYYTPNHYVCGCVATAMAQIMRYFQFPTSGVGTPSFTISVNGSAQTASLRGGNGSGGPYDWANMPLDPGSGTPENQRQAIGALSYDCGVSVSMQYSSGGSGASSMSATERFKDTFDYSNAIYDYDSDNFETDRQQIINSNMDARLPVLFGIGYANPGAGGHAVVGDGYGYQGATLYHHVNMGWGGSYDAWYNLPTIDSAYAYTDIYTITYNIYVSGTGEIISGRVTDAQGNPIAGVAVTAQRSAGGSYNAVSDAKGIYALAKIPSNSTYTLSASKSGYSFQNQTRSTGTSRYGATGNFWGADFTGAVDAEPPAQDDDFLLMMVPIINSFPSIP